MNRRVAGLDEDLEGCPRLDVDTEGFIDAIDVDQTALVVNIAGDLFLRCDPWFWFIATVGTICAANDEFVGFHLQQYNHLTIVPGGDTFNAPWRAARTSGISTGRWWSCRPVARPPSACALSRDHSTSRGSLGTRLVTHGRSRDSRSHHGQM